MKGFAGYLRSKQFLIQIALVLAAIVLLLFITMKWLSAYTMHGEFVVVPDFKNQKIAGLDRFIKEKDVRYQIIDSIYDPREKHGIVLRQDPEPNIKVKHNRTIYLYVTGMVAPQVQMPKLVDRSERQARLILTSYGLKLGRMHEKEADCNGCVLAQMMNGKDITQGTGVKKGSVIDLVIGRKDPYYNTGTGDSTQVEKEEINFE